MATPQENLQEFFKILNELQVYNRCIGKVSFDMECCAPADGIAQAGEDMAVIGQHIFELTHSDKYIELLCALHDNNEGLTDVQKRTVEKYYENYQRDKNFTAEFAYEMDLAMSKAYGEWLTAKQENDFSKYKDAFAKLIEFTQKSIDLRDEKKATYYDTCLDDYEKGGSIAQLDEFFDKLKAGIIPLVKEIKERGKAVRTDFMSRPVPIYKQEACSKKLLEDIGLKKSALVLMTTEHPFTTTFGKKDVRVTTHYYENNFISNVFSTIHEGGHALFMQNEPDEFHENYTNDMMTSAMHECISRFYENIVARSEAYIHFFYPQLLEMTGDTFADITERELYEAVNTAEPGLIRMEADELTYGLHICIRYECEKAFVNGEVTVDEIPALWNKKYKEYLGVDVPDDANGCLQDVHWTGMFGYFPSYQLGNAYGAQILRTMQKDFDVYGAIKAGELDKILDWLREHVFNCASILDPNEWIVEITGEPLNVDYYLDYLREKFAAIYDL